MDERAHDGTPARHSYRSACVEAPRAKPTRISLDNVDMTTLDPNLRIVLRDLTRTLDACGVRHAVVGGIAVVVYGWPRFTKDIDVLVGPEAYERLGGGEERLRDELPRSLGGVEIDYLPVSVGGVFLEVAFTRPVMSDGVPIAPAEVVVCTKLLRHAMRDRADIVEILKAGLIDRASVRGFLSEHTPMLLRRWDALATQADEENE